MGRGKLHGRGSVLAAVLAADVAGYSRLMSVDEEGTLAALKVRAMILPQPLHWQGKHMSLLGRIIVIIFAVIVASMAAGVALAIGIVAPDWATMDSDPVERVSFFVVSFFAISFVGAVAMAPAFVLIVLGEALRIRSFIYYGVAGALVALASYFGSDVSMLLENTTDVPPVGHALQLAAAAGIIGGVAYWLIAGRKAGAWRAS